MLKTLNRLLRNEDGAAAVEYALLAGVIGLAIIGGATALGAGINAVLNDVAAKI